MDILTPDSCLRDCLKSFVLGVRGPRVPAAPAKPLLVGLGHVRGRDRPKRAFLEGLRPSKPPFSG